MPTGMLTIAQAAKQFGVTHRSLRFYEIKGILSPVRSGENDIIAAQIWSGLDRSLR